jgi:hypothetical protein
MHAAIQERCCITRNVETLVDSSESLFLWTLRRWVEGLQGQEECWMTAADRLGRLAYSSRDSLRRSVEDHC